MYIEVAIPLPIFENFIYKVSPHLQSAIKIGCRVKLTFRSKKFYGFVVNIIEKKDIDYESKEIEDIIDKEVAIKPHLWEVAKYISIRYLVSLGVALETVLPRWVKISHTFPTTNPNKPYKINEPEYELTDEQKNAINAIIASFNNPSSTQKFLIWGITSSGKTEIYLQIMKWLLKQGKSSIYIVPEIALTPQVVERVTARFGEMVVIIHSRLTDKQRRQNWNRLYTGDAKIAVGTRSALFAPLDNLGAIIIDEEHENTFKSEQSPRFNIKDIAIKLSEITKSLLIFGTATPSVETYYKAINGEFQLIRLKERINKRPLPEIQVVDIGKEKTNIFGISEHLISSVKSAIDRNEQVLLFINRRGYATFVRCSKCFYVLKCSRCSVAISYHKNEDKLICHHCNFEVERFINCPSCGLGALKMLGFGSQRIEEFVKKTFNISVLRMDSDQEWNYNDYKNAFEQLKQKEIKVLVGTQMVAKGFDFPDITIVGILGVDTLLAFRDFRASERIFQLVIQVAGRAGRATKPGYVFVETLNPESYALQYAQNYDFEGFYNTELDIRKTINLPPFVFLTSIVVEGKIFENAYKKVNTLNDLIKEQAEKNSINCEILGPGQPQYKKLKNLHRFQILLKTKSHQDAITLLHPLKSKFSYSSTLRVIVDPDPLDIL